MFAFLQPLFLVLIGLAMFVYGIIHTVTGFPASAVFSEVVQAVPSLVTVLLFSLGVLAVFVGIYLLVVGVGNTKRRLREIRQTYATRRSNQYQDEEDYYGEPAYR